MPVVAPSRRRRPRSGAGRGASRGAGRGAGRAARRAAGLPVAVLLLGVLAGCSGAGDEPAGTADGGRTASGSSGVSESAADADFPDVLAATLSAQGGDVYALEVTMSSTYDTAERYADGWRVVDDDGEQLATMQLSHDHANEQPFTRTQSGLQVPEGVDEITIEGHDQANGYGGATVTVDVPR